MAPFLFFFPLVGFRKVVDALPSPPPGPLRTRFFRISFRSFAPGKGPRSSFYAFYPPFFEVTPRRKLLGFHPTPPWFGKVRATFFFFLSLTPFFIQFFGFSLPFFRFSSFFLAFTDARAKVFPRPFDWRWWLTFPRVPSFLFLLTCKPFSLRVWKVCSLPSAPPRNTLTF